METVKNILKKILFVHYSFCLGIRRRPFKYLFIMAHMRSGSTLLSHLMNTNRDVAAAAESGEKYASQSDLKKQIFRVFCIHRRIFPRGEYVVDQLNHNRLIPDDHLLDNKNIFCLFMIREPRAALSSILRLDYFRGTEDDALQYYVERLNGLRAYARKIGSPERAMFITHSQLLNHTGEVLDCIQRFTGLSTPFSEQYDVLHITGKVSDPSEKIKSGGIIRNETPPPLSLKESTMEQAGSAYHDCIAEMTTLCSTLDDE